MQPAALLAGLLVLAGTSPALGQSPVVDAIGLAAEAESSERMPLQEAVVTAAVGDVAALVDAARNADATPLAREIAVWALGEVGTDEACGSLSEFVGGGGDDIGIRVVAATAAGRCGDFEPLRSLLAIDSAVVRAKAAIVLGLLGDREALPAVAALRADDAMQELGTFVELAAGLLGDESTVETLEQLLSTRPARHHAAIALARMDRSAAMIDLRLACRNPDPLLRHEALRAFAERRWRGAREAVVAAVADPNPRIAVWATRQAELWEHLGD